MLTDLQIANHALIRLGCESISSFSDNSKRSRIMNEFLGSVRNEILEQYQWDFATKRVTITNNGTTPTFGYTYEFDKPSDLLRIIEIFEANASSFNPATVDFFEDGSGQIYKVEGDKILSDEETLDLVYIFQQTDPSLYTPTFDKVFYLTLAAETAFALAQDKGLKDRLLIDAEKIAGEARFTNSKGSAPRNYLFNTFTNSRL